MLGRWVALRPLLDSLVPFACVQDLTRAVLIREWCMVLVGSMAA